MKDAIQTVLIDPIDENRKHLEQVLGGLGTVWLSESLATYEGAARRVAEVAPRLVVVDIDYDAVQAVQLIQTILQTVSEHRRLAGQPDQDSSIILRVIRAGAREFLTLPAEVEELKETLSRLLHRREEPGSAGRDPERAAGDRDHRRSGRDRLHDARRQPRDHPGQNVRRRKSSSPTSTSMLGSARRLPRHHSRPNPSRRRPEHRPSRPDPAQAVDDPALLGPLRLARIRSRWRTPRSSTPKRSAGCLQLLKAAFPTVVIDTSKGLQSSDFIAFEDGRRDLDRASARPDVPAQHRPPAPTVPAVRGIPRADPPGRQPERLARDGNQPEESRGDAADAGRLARSERHQGGPRGACQGRADRRRRAGQPGPSDDPGDRQGPQRRLPPRKAKSRGAACSRHSFKPTLQRRAHEWKRRVRRANRKSPAKRPARRTLQGHSIPNRSPLWSESRCSKD